MKKDNTIDITARDRAAALKLPSGHERHLVYADAPPDRVALARALKEKRKAPERTAKIQEKAQKLRAAAPKNGMLAKGPVAEKGSARKTVEHSNTADYPDRPAYSAEANDLLKRIPTKVTTTEKGPEFIAATSAAWEKLGGTVHPTHYKEFAKVHYTKDPMALPVARAAPGSNEFYINEKHKFWKNPDVASQLAHANGRYSSADRDSTFHHEAQHKLHHANIGHDRFYSDEMNTWKSPAHKAVSEEVSEYAGHNPAEFVAETYSGIMGGKHYSRPVYDLFDSLGGVRP